MPIRTGLSHAVLGVVIITLWVAFKQILSVFITEEQIVGGVELVAATISTYTGLPVSYSVLVTITSVGVLAVLSFAWGYVFHHTHLK